MHFQVDKGKHPEQQTLSHPIDTSACYSYTYPIFMPPICMLGFMLLPTGMRMCLFLDIRLLTPSQYKPAAFFNAKKETLTRRTMKGLLGNVLQVRNNYSTWIPSARVIQLGRILIIVKNYNLCRLCIDPKPIETPRCISNAYLIGDTICSAYCCRVVVMAADLTMKKCPEGCPIEIEIRTTVYILSKTHLARLITFSAPKKIRVSIQ